MSLDARWYVERLRAMSVAELSARCVLACRKPRWRRTKAWKTPTPGPLPADPWRLPRGWVAEPGLLAEAEGYLRGEYTLLNVKYTERVMDWHLDPQTGCRTPLSFGPDLDYRDAATAGNVKNTWEKNRHHHLTVLALAFATTRDERFAREVNRQLRGWLAANPFMRGVNWTSMLELGVRLTAWVWLDRLLQGSMVHTGLFGPQGVLWPSIYQHQWLMARMPSKGSSANNHLVGEVSGAFLAASQWPVFAESRQWRDHARQVLEREIALQTFPSGLNREQAAAYHLFSLELFLLPALEGDRRGEPLSHAYESWLARMLLALPRLVDVQGHLPRYGDEDGGTALQLRPLGASRLEWLYGVGRRYLGLALPEGEGMARLLWDEPAAGAPFVPPTGSDAFEDAGVYLLAANRSQPDEVLCTADAGPHGYLSIAGHGHADALSFALAVGGHPIIVDPGTFVYHADPALRSYFRSTAAHNTLEVDHADQTLARGPFLWARRQAHTRVLAWEPGVATSRLVAEHDGYTRLAGQVRHRRTFELTGGLLELTDEVTGGGTHALATRLHFAPGCKATLEAGRCVVSWARGTLAISLDPRFTWLITRGWYSSGFNLKEPCDTLTGSAKLELPVKICQRIDININAQANSRVHKLNISPQVIT